MINLEQQITANSDLSAYLEHRGGLPPLDQFVSFLALRLQPDLSVEPTSIELHVTRATKHSFKITGDVTLDARVTPIEGNVHWLPNLDCFRGHITIDPEGRVNDILTEDADAVRSIDWHKTAWGGDDHDHCRLCMATISSYPGDANFDVAYTADDSGWLCPTCYNHVVVNGGNHPWIKRE